MNTRSLIKLFIALLVLVGAQILSKTPEANQKAVPQIADGGLCTPWTPTKCSPAARWEVSDGGQCIPWTPTTCVPSILQQPVQRKGKTEVADGGQCIPWTPDTCRPMKAREQG